MSEIQHTSLKGELLYLIGRASAPLSGAELYERCELADEIVKVSKALANLQNDGKIVRVEGPGRARYKLSDGVAAPAPAGKTGRTKAMRARASVPAQEAGLPVVNIPASSPAPDALTETFERLAHAGKQKADEEAIARGLDLAAQHLGDAPTESDARLADAILARLKRQLAPLMRPPVVGDVEVTTAPGAIHVHVQSVEINITVGVGA